MTEIKAISIAELRLAAINAVRPVLQKWEEMAPIEPNEIVNLVGEVAAITVDAILDVLTEDDEEEDEDEL